MDLFLSHLLELALLSAPWLVLGLVVAGLIRAWLPVDLVGRSLGGTGLGSVTRAALIGAPLPLCSCGTLPAAFSLRRSGASKGSTVSFLIATPETGVDSVALSWVLLGPLMAILRPFAAILSAITAGLLVGHSERRELSSTEVREPSATAATCGSGCCESSCEVPDPATESLLMRTLAGLRYAFTDLLDDLTLWLAAGLVAAALVMTLAPPGMLAEWGSGLLPMLMVLLVSVPMYVCATASTPLAHAMLYAGVSPGTVLVFLLAGPATNMAGIALVKRELGRNALIMYLFGVAGMSLLLGLLLDYTLGWLEWDLLAQLTPEAATENELPAPFSAFCFILLLVMAIKPLRRLIVRGKSDAEGGCCN